MSETLTQSQLITAVAEDTELKRADVKRVFESIDSFIKGAVGRRGAGKVRVFGLQVERKKLKARPARDGRNPATGEPMRIKAKPARIAIKARALKALRDQI